MFTVVSLFVASLTIHGRESFARGEEEEAEEAMDAETSAIQPIEPDSADETTSQEGADSEEGIDETEK